MPLLKKTVLIIEDDIDIADSLAELLADAGYGVERARDGLEAMERFRQPTLPEVILLDLRMPRLSGTDFLKAVAADARLRDVPIVVITATRSQSIPAGLVRRILRKPLDAGEVLEAVDFGDDPVLH